MFKYLTIALSLALAGPALGHSDSKFMKGPNGGHVVDAGGGKQHWELVAKGGDVILFVTDKDEKPINITAGTAEAQILIAGKNYTVPLAPAGANTLKGTGAFVATKGMRVIIKTTAIGGESFQARLTPLQ